MGVQILNINMKDGAIAIILDSWMDVIEVKKVEQHGFLLIEEDSRSHLSTAIANSENAVQVADNNLAGFRVMMSDGLT